MPTYEYACASGHHWDVIKPISAFDDPERCPECQARGDRQLTLPNIDRSAAADWNTPQWSPALGCAVKSNKHARQIAKRRGLEEIGNEKPETLHKIAEKTQEETRARRWAEADREKVYGD